MPGSTTSPKKASKASKAKAPTVEKKITTKTLSIQKKNIKKDKPTAVVEDKSKSTDKSSKRKKTATTDVKEQSVKLSPSPSAPRKKAKTTAKPDSDKKKKTQQKSLKSRR